MIDPSMMMGGGMAPQPEPAPRSFDEIRVEVQELLREMANADGTVDAIEEAKIQKILAQIADLGANRAREEQAALGGGPATKFLGRTLGGA